MMSNERKRREALVYHAKPKPGKIEVRPTKKYSTQRDLSLAYSPGVAQPCLEIAKNKENVYKYTTKGNLVAVISNGTAVLGLGDIGPEASKPVMEGKGLLFKIFADIDVFDIEINESDPSDAGRGKIKPQRRAEPPGTNQQNTACLQFLLPAEPDLGENQVPAIALDLVVAKLYRGLFSFQGCGSPSGYGRNDRDDVISFK